MNRLIIACFVFFCACKKDSGKGSEAYERDHILDSFMTATLPQAFQVPKKTMNFPDDGQQYF